MILDLLVDLLLRVDVHEQHCTFVVWSMQAVESDVMFYHSLSIDSHRFLPYLSSQIFLHTSLLRAILTAYI